MAQIDFHSQVGDKIHYTCRLVRKILSLAKENEPFQTIVILGATLDIEKLNDLLWTFSQDDFLPHSLSTHESCELSPVLLADELSDTLLDQIPHEDVFIHLGQTALPQIEKLLLRFKRVIEVVSTEPIDLQAGRDRYKHYRNFGLELQNFDQKGAS